MVYDIDELKSASADWLRTEFKGSKKTKVNRSALMKALIMAELRHCQVNGPPEESRTLRNVWYRIIKSAIMRAEGILAETPNWSRRVTKQLSSIISKLVLSGIMRYSDINLVDKSRSMYPDKKNMLEYHHFAGDLRPYDDVVIFIEKDTLFDAIKNVGEIYNVPTFEGSGFAATSAIEKLLDIIAEHNENNEGEDRLYKIIVLSDFDSYGYQIVEDLGNRAKQLGLNCEIIRAGVEPSQFDPTVIDTMKYPVAVKTNYDRKWIATHAIDGRYGLELDAMENEELRKILTDALEKHCPEKVLFDAIREDTAELTDDWGSKNAAKEILSKRKDPRTLIIELLEQLKDLVQKEVDGHEDEIYDIFYPYAEEYLEDEDFDDREDIEDGQLIKQAIGRKNRFRHTMTSSPLTNKIEETLLDEHIDEVPDFDFSKYEPLIDPLKKLADDFDLEYNDYLSEDDNDDDDNEDQEDEW